MSEGDYTLVGVPEEHPIAILNKRGNNGDQISYAPKISGNYEVDITFIKVVGGQLQPPYYQFYLWGAPYGWANGPEIFINNSDNTFKFMRNKQYIFNFNEVDSQHPFKLFINKGTEEPPLNDQNDYQFTFSSDDNSESYYQCGYHSGMKENLSFLVKEVEGEEYDFYYGDVSVSVSGDFGTQSVHCYHHGAMGGDNLLTYSSECS